MQTENKTLEQRLYESQEALYETKTELEELMMALSELINYDTSLKLNSVDLRNYATKKEETETGKLSYRFLCEHRRIMWLVRTAIMYCDEAQDICEGALE